jgi:hypothetical protein
MCCAMIGLYTYVLRNDCLVPDGFYAIIGLFIYILRHDWLIYLCFDA